MPLGPRRSGGHPAISLLYPSPAGPLHPASEAPRAGCSASPHPPEPSRVLGPCTTALSCPPPCRAPSSSFPGGQAFPPRSPPRTLSPQTFDPAPPRAVWFPVVLNQRLVLCALCRLPVPSESRTQHPPFLRASLWQVPEGWGSALGSRGVQPRAGGSPPAGELCFHIRNASDRPGRVGENRGQPGDHAWAALWGLLGQSAPRGPRAAGALVHLGLAVRGLAPESLLGHLPLSRAVRSRGEAGAGCESALRHRAGAKQRSALHSDTARGVCPGSVPLYLLVVSRRPVFPLGAAPRPRPPPP